MSQKSGYRFIWKGLREDASGFIVLQYETGTNRVNLASGNETTIKEIAEIVKKKIKYDGNIIWDETKPSGPKRRFVDINKAKSEFGYRVTTSLEEGINKTVDWYVAKL